MFSRRRGMDLSKGDNISVGLRGVAPSRGWVKTNGTKTAPIWQVTIRRRDGRTNRTLSRGAKTTKKGRDSPSFLLTRNCG